MEHWGEPEQDVTRRRLAAQEAEQEQQRLYSLWERLAKNLIGKDDDQERRDYTMRKPDTE